MHREVAEALGYKRDAIRRMENGEQGIKLIVAKGLCEFFGIEGAEKSHMCELAVKSNERGWWEPFVDKATGRRPSAGFPLFLEAEQEASHFRILETEVVPGLLQTRGYTAELAHTALPNPDQPLLELLDFREKRQKRVFSRVPAPTLEIIIGPAVLVYINAMPREVRDGQIARFEEIDRLPFVEICVLTGMHAGHSGAFNILNPGDGGPPFVFLDAADGCRYIEHSTVVSRFERISCRCQGEDRFIEGVSEMTTKWRKSSRSISQADNNCVEVRFAEGQFEVRDSKLGDDSPILQLDTTEFFALLPPVKR
ncbi:hypothetical protein GCM10029992_52950 [Glycomyces albus]